MTNKEKYNLSKYANSPAIGSRAWRGMDPKLKAQDLEKRDKAQFEEISDYADKVVNNPQAPGGPGMGQFSSTSRGHYDAGGWFGGVTNRPAAHPFSTMPNEQVKDSPEFKLTQPTPNRLKKEGNVGSSGPNGDGYAPTPAAPAAAAPAPAGPPAGAPAPAGTPGPAGVPSAPSVKPTVAPPTVQLTPRQKYDRDAANRAGASAIGSYNKQYGENAWAGLGADKQTARMKRLLGKQYQHYTGG